MTSALNKFCTGFNCRPDRYEDCYLYDPNPVNPFMGFSPMASLDGECPYYHPKPWGDGPEVVE